MGAKQIIPCCSVCRFWKYDKEKTYGEGVFYAKCRRFPPVITRDSGGDESAGWHDTMGWDWCGEFRQTHESRIIVQKRTP